MKKKNFLRNLSTTALAMCCLSSAVAFPSFASFEENLRNSSCPFEEEEEAVHLPSEFAQAFTEEEEAVHLPSPESLFKGSKIEFTQAFKTADKLPIDEKDGKVDFVRGESFCEVNFEGTDAQSPYVTVTGSKKNNNRIVFIPKKFYSVCGEKTVIKISPDANFPNTKVLVYPRDFESDKNALNMREITKNNPGIGFAPYTWEDVE